MVAVLIGQGCTAVVAVSGGSAAADLANVAVISVVADADGIVGGDVGLDPDGDIGVHVDVGGGVGVDVGVDPDGDAGADPAPFVPLLLVLYFLMKFFFTKRVREAFFSTCFGARPSFVASQQF